MFMEFVEGLEHLFQLTPTTIEDLIALLFVSGTFISILLYARARMKLKEMALEIKEQESEQEREDKRSKAFIQVQNEWTSSMNTQNKATKQVVDQLLTTIEKSYGDIRDLQTAHSATITELMSKNATLRDRIEDVLLSNNKALGEVAQIRVEFTDRISRLEERLIATKKERDTFSESLNRQEKTILTTVQGIDKSLKQLTLTINQLLPFVIKVGEANKEETNVEK